MFVRHEFTDSAEDSAKNSVLDDPCFTCVNAEQETMGQVASCNCCEDYSFYRQIKSSTQTNPA